MHTKSRRCCDKVRKTRRKVRKERRKESRQELWGKRRKSAYIIKRRLKECNEYNERVCKREEPLGEEEEQVERRHRPRNGREQRNGVEVITCVRTKHRRNRMSREGDRRDRKGDRQERVNQEPGTG